MHEQPSPSATLAGFHVGSARVRKALLYSFWDGMACNGMTALNETFAVAAAVSLRASSMAIALMSALPLLLGSVSQYLTPALIDANQGRKRYVLLGVRLQSLFLFLAGFTGWIPDGYAPWAFVLAFACASISASSTGAFWVSWMGDLIPGDVRGRHFAWRSVFFSWSYLSCSLVAGIISRHYTSHNTPWALFACVFTAAALFRTVSYQCMARQYEPPHAHPPQAFAPLKFRPGRDFFTYSLGTAAFQGAASMSGPFFNVWYLRDLHFDYFSLSMSLCASVLGSIAFAGFWGRMADNFGTARVLRISGLLVTFIPLPYLFFDKPWQIWLFCFYSGSTWAGYNMAIFNHVLSATEKSQRAHYIAFNSLMGGVIGFCFSLAGGYLATHLPVLLGWRLRALFLLSTAIRFAVVLALFHKFREYRDALPRRKGEVFMELPGYRVGAGLYRNVSRAFSRSE